MMTRIKILRKRSDTVRPASTASLAIGKRTKALDEALLQILGQADGRAHRTKDDGLHQNSRNQIVHVRRFPEY